MSEGKKGGFEGSQAEKRELAPREKGLAAVVQAFWDRGADRKEDLDELREALDKDPELKALGLQFYHDREALNQLRSITNRKFNFSPNPNISLPEFIGFEAEGKLALLPFSQEAFIVGSMRQLLRYFAEWPDNAAWHMDKELSRAVRPTTFLKQSDGSYRLAEKGEIEFGEKPLEVQRSGSIVNLIKKQLEGVPAAEIPPSPPPAAQPQAEQGTTPAGKDHEAEGSEELGTYEKECLKDPKIMTREAEEAFQVIVNLQHDLNEQLEEDIDREEWMRLDRPFYSLYTKMYEMSRQIESCEDEQSRIACIRELKPILLVTLFRQRYKELENALKEEGRFDLYWTPKAEAPEEKIPREFEDRVYEGEKLAHDSLRKLLRELGVGEELIQSVQYKAIVKKETVPPEGKWACAAQAFSNYHDYLEWRKTLSREDAKHLDGGYRDSVEWDSPAVLANKELWALFGEGGSLAAYSNGLHMLLRNMRRGSEQDDYARAVRAGEVGKLTADERALLDGSAYALIKSAMETRKTPARWNMAALELFAKEYLLPFLDQCEGLAAAVDSLRRQGDAESRLKEARRLAPALRVWKQELAKIEKAFQMDAPPSKEREIAELKEQLRSVFKFLGTLDEAQLRNPQVVERILAFDSVILRGIREGILSMDLQRVYLSIREPVEVLRKQK